MLPQRRNARLTIAADIIDNDQPVKAVRLVTVSSESVIHEETRTIETHALTTRFGHMIDLEALATPPKAAYLVVTFANDREAVSAPIYFDRQH